MQSVLERSYQDALVLVFAEGDFASIGSTPCALLHEIAALGSRYRATGRCVARHIAREGTLARDDVLLPAVSLVTSLSATRRRYKPS